MLPTIVSFAHAHTSPPRSLGDVLGGKGANLAEMTSVLRLPVPPGFTLTTAAAARALDAGDAFVLVEPDLRAAVAALQTATGRRLGSAVRPLLVSVRSGAPASMPGMMDTILNVGLNRRIAIGLAQRTGDPQFAWDSYRRLAQMYAEAVLAAAADVAGTAEAIARDHAQLHDRLAAFDRWLDDHAPLPVEPWDQLLGAVGAVVRSWNSERACTYRRIEGIPDRPCTAVNVQAMVFGNLGANSGSGVAFTRDPSTGEPRLVGDYLAGAQGEDVVAGTHRTATLDTLARELPEAASQLRDAAGIVERHLGDMCDIEFTVEEGRLWLLQVRAGKRSPRAALRIAIDMAQDPALPLTRGQAVERTARILGDPPQEGPALDELVPPDLVHRGVAASPGVGVGRACFDPEAVIELAACAEPAILVRQATSPADVHGMAEAAAVVTALGGMMSHAAVVARGWGIPAVVGVESLCVRDAGATLGGVEIGPGDWLTVDGTSGALAVGCVQVARRVVPEVATLQAWRDELPDAAVAANAPADDGHEAASPAADVPLTERVAVVLSIRGTATAGGLAEALIVPPPEVAAALAEMELAGTVVSAARGVGLSDQGAADVAARFAAAHRQLVTRGGDAALLDDFDDVNARLKATVSTWQMRLGKDDGATILCELDAVHAEVDRWLEGLAGAYLVELYRVRLQRALDRVRSGDAEWVLSPRIDSYHSVWFELHEHLIRLAGRTRAEEAAAGRAH